MQQQLYRLADFSATYRAIEKDKKKAGLKTLEFILEINKAVGFDEILVREGFEAYPSKPEIEAKRTEEAYLAFFTHLRQNLSAIESSYLRDSSDLKLIEEAQGSDPQEYNFLLNKNSVSKFVRDEAAHFQQVSDQYLQAISAGEEQKGVKSNRMHAFMVGLFSSRYTAVIRQRAPYLAAPTPQLQADIGTHLLQYAQQVREIPEEQAQQGYFIAEEEILDFLTYWLKHEKSIFILYARTQQRLAQESRFITSQAHLPSPVHPSRMTAQEIVEREEQIQLVRQEQLKPQPMQPPSQQPAFQPGTPEHLSLNLKERQRVPDSERKQSQAGHCKEASKQELLRGQLKGLFEFGCKRRYKHNKNSTFSDIQQETQTMDLEKFINFCAFFELTAFLNKELVTEYFKMFALNLRTLDFPRFQNALLKLAQADQRVADNLLRRAAFESKLRQQRIRSSQKAGGLSSYKFTLRPINGKDVSTIEKELSFRRLERLIVREEKEKKAYSRREEAEREPRTGRASRVASRVASFSTQKIAAGELEPIRDSAFNPEKLISNGEKDKLWDAYEAKIWREERSNSTLEAILSKRIQRGNVVVTKLNSHRSFIYDQ